MRVGNIFNWNWSKIKRYFIRFLAVTFTVCQLQVCVIIRIAAACDWNDFIYLRRLRRVWWQFLVDLITTYATYVTIAEHTSSQSPTLRRVASPWIITSSALSGSPHITLFLSCRLHQSSTEHLNTKHNENQDRREMIALLDRPA